MMRYQHHNSLGQMNEVLTELTIDGAEVVRVAHNAILVSRMHLATIALCKQTTDNFRTRNPPEPRWRHLSGNRILFVPHSWMTNFTSNKKLGRKSIWMCISHRHVINLEIFSWNCYMDAYLENAFYIMLINVKTLYAIFVKMNQTAWFIFMSRAW